MLASLNNPVAPNGSYYVTVQGVNGAATGPASPEINIVIPGGCVAPGTPQNLTAIVRGSQSWIAWNAGTGGVPSTYWLQASLTSGMNFDAGVLGQAPFATPAFNLTLPAGTYYLRACLDQCVRHERLLERNFGHGRREHAGHDAGARDRTPAAVRRARRRVPHRAAGQERRADGRLGVMPQPPGLQRQRHRSPQGAT